VTGPDPAPGAGPITTDEYHTGGEPFRIVTAGVPDLQGATVAERRLWAAAHLDATRRLLVHEPRGHADMYGGFPTPPDDDGADLGVVFFHNDGFSTACGHGTIALATWAVDTGRVAPGEDGTATMRIDVPSGRLDVTAHLDADGRVEAVAFANVPAFVLAEVEIAPDDDEEADEVEEDGAAVATIAFGGAFYAIVDAADVGISLADDPLPEIVGWCRDLKDELNGSDAWVHPDHERLAGIYGVILVEPADLPADGVPLPLGAQPWLVQRNLTVFADGEVDRSPTGSGTSARLAALHHQGRIAVGQGLVNLSPVDSVMTAVIDATTTVGAHPAVRTTVAGAAYRTGSSTFTVDPRDPLRGGFLLR
jgi:proline racemase